MNSITCEIYEDTAGEWRWRLKASNGEVIATGESHGSPGDAERAVVNMINLVSEVPIEVKRVDG